MAKKTMPKKKVARKKKRPKNAQLLQLERILRTNGLPGLYQVLRTKHGGEIPKQLEDKINRRTAALIVTEISNKISDRELSSVDTPHKVTHEIAIKSRESIRLGELYKREGMPALNAEMREINQGKFPNALQVKIRNLTIKLIMDAIMKKIRLAGLSPPIKFR